MDLDLGIWGRGFWNEGDTDTCRSLFRAAGSWDSVWRRPREYGGLRAD